MYSSACQPKVSRKKNCLDTFKKHILASRGLDETAHASRWLDEPFFQLCCCVSFWFWREIGFGFYILLCTWSTIQLWCCVGFFCSGGK